MGARLEAFDDHHGATTGGTGIGQARFIGAVVEGDLAAWIIDWRRMRLWGEKVAGQLDIASAAAVGEQAIVSNTMEAVGQDMEEEAADELVGGQGHEFLAFAAVCPIILVREGDASPVAADQTAV